MIVESGWFMTAMKFFMLWIGILVMFQVFYVYFGEQKKEVHNSEEKNN